MTTKETDKKYIAPTYGRFDVCIEKGSGSTMFDENGREYIDFTSGIGVTSFGINDDEWKSAVKAQLDLVQHTSNLYYTRPCAELAELLCEKSGMDKVFFGNSGAEANECAIKFARKYSHDKYGGERSDIITLKDSFHGRTITTLAATGQDEFHKDFDPFTPGFRYCAANDCEALEKAVDDKVCAIMFECIQGEGGVNDLSEEFVAKIAEIAEKNDILTICDEVQTGNGRTGKYFSYEHFGIKPDIVTTAKGLGGGLPIGAALFNKKVSEHITPGSHGSTFGGNPIVAAGAVSIVKRIDDDLFDAVNAKSEYIVNTVSKFKNVTAISGKGLMLGISTEKDAGEIAKQCLENGLLVLTAHKNKVRLLPALNIKFGELNKGLEILKEVIEK